eukprot:scaffold89293_cov44-Phaeocystis_antarctica.AAC.2
MESRPLLTEAPIISLAVSMVPHTLPRPPSAVTVTARHRTCHLLVPGWGWGRGHLSSPGRALRTDCLHLSSSDARSGARQS